MSDDPEIHEGSCLCGGARFRVTGPLAFMSHCHCTDCRKAHAAAFATFVTVSRDQVEWPSGRGTLRQHVADSGAIRHFCGACGTLMTWERPADPSIDLSAAIFDTPITLRARDHLFVRSKVPWFDIMDGLPQHQGHRPVKR